MQTKKRTQIKIELAYPGFFFIIINKETWNENRWVITAKELEEVVVMGKKALDELNQEVAKETT